jgi:hypothetical protein
MGTIDVIVLIILSILALPLIVLSLLGIIVWVTAFFCFWSTMILGFIKKIAEIFGKS